MPAAATARLLGRAGTHPRRHQADDAAEQLPELLVLVHAAERIPVGGKCSVEAPQRGDAHSIG